MPETRHIRAPRRGPAPRVAQAAFVTFSGGAARACLRLLFALLCGHGAGAAAEPVLHLDLVQAQHLAIAQAPRVRAARMALAASRDAIDVARAGYLPQVMANISAVDAGHIGGGANDDARIAAGGLNNPTVLSRAAGGVAIDQLVTDFGRTSSLVASARADEDGRSADVKTTEADVVLEVTRIYFQVLEAQALRAVAADALAERRQVADRTALLAQSKLKSSLDVSFANVAVEQARILVLRAENDVQSATARLAAALGMRERSAFALEDDTPTDTAPPPGALDALFARAIAARPELARLRADRDAATLLAKAARAQDYPEIDLHGVAGGTPAGDRRFTDGYAAAGVTVKVPLFDGYRHRSEAHAALHRAATLGALLDDAENLVVRDVRIDWLEARANFETLGVTAQLRVTARQSLDLAQASYNAGLSSIVDLGQAQLNATDSELAYARARYEYRIATATLDYAVGGVE